MSTNLGHRPPGPESPLPSPEGRENVPSYARLKGPEERGAELLTLLNIARDRQRGTLQLLGDLGPPHSEQNHAFRVCAETGIALGRMCSLIQGGDALPLNHKSPGRSSSAQGIHPVEPLGHAQSEEPELEFGHATQQCRDSRG